jgi:hypothetical protein
MKKFTFLMVFVVLTTFMANAQINRDAEGLIGFYTFSNADDLFMNYATEAGVGTVKCEGVMKFDPDAEDPSFDDMPSEENVDWEVIAGIHDNAISLKAHNWFKVWHGIPANGGGDYVNDFAVVIDIKVSDAEGIYSLLEVNPTPKENGYTSELEIAELLKVGSVGAPASGEDALGFSEQAITADTWYRIVYSAKLSEGIYIYVNGELWHSMEGDFKDARPAPYGADTDPADAAFKVCGNNEVAPANDPPRDGDKDIDMIAVFNRTLSAEDVAALGAPGEWMNINDNDQSQSIQLYPNPATNILNISGAQGAKIEVVSITGQIVVRTVAEAQTASIDVSHLNQGVYFVRLTTENGQSSISKVIIE